MPKPFKILKLLENRFGIELDLDQPVDHLKFVAEHYDSKRNNLLLKEGDLAMETDQYAKSLFISEAIRIQLREIAPKRTKRRK